MLSGDGIHFASIVSGSILKDNSHFLLPNGTVTVTDSFRDSFRD